MDTVDCVIVGAGVVGLACARALALDGYEVIVLENNPSIGMETSSRNSEVIHSGIYYPEGSLKAFACVRGKELIYEYCKQRHIPFRKTGKLVVATSSVELDELKILLERGKVNGVTDLELLNRKEALLKEPSLNCDGALWSPSTGIIDSHSFMVALQGELEEGGGWVVFNTPLESGQIVDNLIILRTGGIDPIEFKTRFLINSAGLSAQRVARKIEGFPKSSIPKLHMARGVYFSLTKKSPFQHLVYPAPESGGLGVHATLDLAGQCRFGPDVEWVDEENYDVDPLRASVFYDRIRKYWPDLEDGSLQPAYAGIRSKIVSQGKPSGDFLISGPSQHKSGNIIHLFGIESPGLTSSMAIAELILNEVKHHIKP